MTQPMDRTCSLPALGEIDRETGEFWLEQVFQMPRERMNLSAFERNRSFLNLGGQAFIDCSFASGSDIDSDSRSVVAADFDRDGKPDLLVGSVGGGPVRLFLNQFPAENRTQRIHLVGGPSNRQGIGARITAECNGQRIVRDVFPPNGCLGQGPPETLLGVGSAQKIDRLEVRWPTGHVQEFLDVPVGKALIIDEGQAVPRFSTDAAL